MKIKKNQFLAAFLTGLTMVSVALGYWDKESGGARIDADFFAIDEIDQVDRVLISHQGDVLDCRAYSGGFMINEKIPMDESFLNLLAAILQQVKVQRPLTKAESQKIWSQLQGSGRHIQVFAGEQMLASYWAGGDGSKLNSYFATEAGEVYLVHLPGYSFSSYPRSNGTAGPYFLIPGDRCFHLVIRTTYSPSMILRLSIKTPFFLFPGSLGWIVIG